MSLKRNVLANYVSQIYVTLIGIIMVPLYLKYMGAEAYGLVGFYVMLQAWFMLLDMGLTPTLSRETARFRGGATDAVNLRHLLHTLEGIFVGVALLGATIMMVGAGYIATSWLKVQELSVVEVQHAILLMAIIVALRWVSGLYRGAVNGFERMVWLSGFNIAIATARFVLVIPFFIYVGTSPTEFFSYQLLLTVVELLTLIIQTYRLMPKIDNSENLPWQWQPLCGVLKFSLTIAFTSAIWVLVTQTDKLVLSKLLPLSEYAYFTLAVLVASGIMVASGPISGALLPRMTKLNAEGNEADLIKLYRNATQMVALIAIPVALILGFFAKQVLFAWTGNEDIAHKAAQVLSLYALGNGILALAAFPFYLQFAKGDLKLHLIGNALFVVIFIPLLIWAVSVYGMVGAGYAWIIANLLPFIIWLPIVHRHFVKGLHTQWLLFDICAIALPTALVAAVMFNTLTWPNERIAVLKLIIITSLVLCLVAITSSSWARGEIKQLIIRWQRVP